jgi:predicted nuclease of restriction endonuclease-like (RecB) superfamily
MELHQYGKEYLAFLSDIKDQIRNAQGYSYRNLKYMRAFATENMDFVIGQSPTAQISWTHNMLLLDKCKDQRQRLWYAQKSIENG